MVESQRKGKRMRDERKNIRLKTSYAVSGNGIHMGRTSPLHLSHKQHTYLQGRFGCSLIGGGEWKFDETFGLMYAIECITTLGTRKRYGNNDGMKFPYARTSFFQQYPCLII